MVTQSSKQSQNNIIKNKKSVSDFHNSCLSYIKRAYNVRVELPLFFSMASEGMNV